MFKNRIELFKLFGFPVRLDMTWFILAALITWSLAMGLFPAYYPGLTQTSYWVMGLMGAIGLFASIVIHEFSHSLVARRYGMPISGITLFIFGGIAEMEAEPPSAKAEFLMAIIGPVTSLLIGGAFWMLLAALGSLTGGAAAAPSAVAQGTNVTLWSGVLDYLARINILLALFNMVPAFPLDGGRVLRAILWGVKGNIEWATRITSQIGVAFGFFLMAVGVFDFIGGNFIGGLWKVMIGLFLRGAATTSYENQLVRQALEGEKVARIMVESPVAVPDNITIQELVDSYVEKDFAGLYPVVDGKRMSGVILDNPVLGSISLEKIKQIPKNRWRTLSVHQLMTPSTAENTVSPDTEAIEVVEIMKKQGNSGLLVVVEGHLMGMVTFKDLVKFISDKVEIKKQLST